MIALSQKREEYLRDHLAPCWLIIIVTAAISGPAIVYWLQFCQHILTNHYMSTNQNKGSLHVNQSEECIIACQPIRRVQLHVNQSEESILTWLRSGCRNICRYIWQNRNRNTPASLLWFFWYFFSRLDMLVWALARISFCWSLSCLIKDTELLLESWSWTNQRLVLHCINQSETSIVWVNQSGAINYLYMVDHTQKQSDAIIETLVARVQCSEIKIYYSLNF